ncbi:MAG: hypothetical protein GKS03_14960 [Alphaproteobacteria bacterium]|nr:hypothetical protein [Alphaproteobacteria bacterium]
MVDHTAPAPLLPEATSKPILSQPAWYTRPRLAALWQDIISRKEKMTTSKAVTEFLSDMKRISDRQFPEWLDRLKSHIEESDLPFEHKREIIEKHDFEMYFYCAIVAAEAIKAFKLFERAPADELMSDINDQIDGALGRNGRDAADLVFDMLRTVKRSQYEEMYKSHDQLMKWIVRLIELDTRPETKEISEDIVFRQEMAEPLAFCYVHWWLGFKETRRLAPVY